MSIMDITEKRAFEQWKAGTPAHANHPDEERKAGDTLLVPLYSGSSIINVLSVEPNGSASTFSSMVQPQNRNSPTKGVAKTQGVVAVAGRAEDGGSIIPDTKVAGSERDYVGGRLAGASRVFLTVGWDNARRIFEATGEPAVAALEGGLLPASGDSVGKNLIHVANDLRCALPAETAITIAVTDDRTPSTRDEKRMAGIKAEQAEEVAKEFSDSSNAKEWKRRETREEAEKLRMAARSTTAFDAAAYLADLIKARLLTLSGSGA